MAFILCAFWLLLPPPGLPAQTPASSNNSRRPRNENDWRYWLENMVWHHRFSLDEIQAATGVNRDKITADLERWQITKTTKPKRAPGSNLLVLPYPGGRHPRIGFLEGAVDPQRETKISVFAPWDDAAYVVVDVPEAIWSNLGLSYLAHTHVPTIWSKRNIELATLEWNRREDGLLEIERKLPNGIAFGALIHPRPDGVRMELWLFNGASETLTDLRVQNCVMLKGAPGFAQQTNTNKHFAKPYAACRSSAGNRWIITAWEPCHRPWANEPVPCLHSDPQFPDCPSGERKKVTGWLSFYEGTNIEAELNRLDELGWRAP